ncbi:MAG: Gfo/Idh/MocA family oxidoreductase [Acidimicrobiia bacterium]|nr:Gfo/Idh/MocA family oxidoreductase [Acidimicrobiia bacterium]
MAHAAAYVALRDRFVVRAVSDPDDARVAAVTGWLRDLTVLSFDEVCAADDIDVVDLCTPPYLHLAQIEQALRSGKHVVCEKPLVASLADLDRVAALSEATGRRVMPVFQYRYGAGLQRLKAAVAAGVTGRAYTASVEVGWRRGPEYYAAPWRGTWDGEFGGVLTTHAVHHLDMVMEVLGPMASVSAQVATRVNDVEDEDCAAAVLTTADGALVSLVATLGSVEEISRNRFCFEHLSAESHTGPYDHATEPWHFCPTAETSERFAAVEAPSVRDGFAGQFEGLHAALVDGAPLPVDLDDARRAIEVVTACYASAAAQRLVLLPLEPDDPAYRGVRP